MLWFLITHTDNFALSLTLCCQFACYCFRWTCPTETPGITTCRTNVHFPLLSSCQKPVKSKALCNTPRPLDSRGQRPRYMLDRKLGTSQLKLSQVVSEINLRSEITSPLCVHYAPCANNVKWVSGDNKMSNKCHTEENFLNFGTRWM
jgi:hypothetical protein